jgi:hypothetical protein
MALALWNRVFPAKPTEKEAIVFELCPSVTGQSSGILLFPGKEDDRVHFEESQVERNRFLDLKVRSRVVVTLLRDSLQSVRVIDENVGGREQNNNGRVDRPQDVAEAGNEENEQDSTVVEKVYMQSLSTFPWYDTGVLDY